MGDLSERLEELMRARCLTAHELSQFCVLSRTSLHRLLTGKVTDPKLSTLIVLADYFNITIDELINRKVIH